MFYIINEDMIDYVISYLKKNILKCVYLYINLIKYGVNNININGYVYLDEVDDIKCVIVKYYNGIQIYSENNDFDKDELVKLLNVLKPNVISGELDTIKNIYYDFIDKYNLEIGYVSKLDRNAILTENTNKYRIEKNNKNLLYQISDLICSDYKLGGHYTKEGLYKQLKDRIDDNFGRNYVILDKNGIVSHAATYAEIDNISVIGGVITRSDKRGKGIGSFIVNELCNDLILEGKEVYLFYENSVAGQIYKKIGFIENIEWMKLKFKVG